MNRNHNSCLLNFYMLLKMVLIMGSPVAGGLVGGCLGWRARVGGLRPVLCPEHISKTILPTVMKFHAWIHLIKGECSAQES